MTCRKIRSQVQVAALVALIFAGLAPAREVRSLRFNGLDMGIDEQTGSLIYLSFGATGPILEAPPEAAGLLDVAYPVRVFTPLRLASRFSKARVVKEGDGVSIVWDILGPSRNSFPLPQGKVSARVSIQAARDGRSAILSCRIENHSSQRIPQVLFPDLWGLKPLGGPERAQLRLARGVVHPFMVPFRPPEAAPPYYDQVGWQSYSAHGGYYTPNALRWLDYGSYGGGLSVFQRKWGTQDAPDVMTYRSEGDPTRLRLAWEHRESIEPGQTWVSGEFWLTPHSGGWAKGIEVFRDYVWQVNPPRPLPAHIRDGVGFQTIWMTQAAERDPAKAYFRFKDLPRVAQDAHEHSITELVPWFWCHYFSLPIRLREDLGTQQEFLEAVRRARELGVNVAPFISVVVIRNSEVGRYGVEPGHSDWTYHPELIPPFGPYYTRGIEGEDAMEGVVIDGDNRLWQQDVLASVTDWINRGIYSPNWDVFLFKAQSGHKPALIQLIERVRSLARAKDPESTFGGESNSDLELENQVIDYTWNWVDYVDAGPILNVLRSPRLNCNINASPLVVKKGFAEGLYLNLMPSRLDQPNGTAMISERPALSAALKQVAALRRQFLPFFVEGTPLGDSFLSEPSTTFVRGHRYGNRLLVIVLNDQPEPRPITLQSDLGLWLPSARGLRVKHYDADGKLVKTTHIKGSRWVGVSRLLQPLELSFFEIESLEQ